MGNSHGKQPWEIAVENSRGKQFYFIGGKNQLPKNHPDLTGNIVINSDFFDKSVT